jgi:hypothetical protein
MKLLLAVVLLLPQLSLLPAHSIIRFSHFSICLKPFQVLNVLIVELRSALSAAYGMLQGFILR